MQRQRNWTVNPMIGRIVSYDLCVLRELFGMGCSCIYSLLCIAMTTGLLITFIKFGKYPIDVFYVTVNESFHLYHDSRLQFT